MNRTQRMVLALMLAIPFLSALLAYPVLPSTARAQQSENSVCPLTDDQTEKSIQAFDKIANVFTKEPRCVNCHGVVDPFGADANITHGGGKLDPVMKTELNELTGEPETTRDVEATFQECQGCHGASSGWVIPPELSFVGKDALTLCKLQKDFFSNASDFIKHIEHDALIQEAFTGRMGLNDVGRRLMLPPYVFARRSIPYPAPPTGVTHRDLIQMAHDWVDAQGGTFRGDSECGCKHLCDDCLSGSYQFVEDSFRKYPNYTQKVDHRTSVLFSFPTAGGAQRGRATVTASHRQELHDPPGHPCSDSIDSTEPYQYVVDVRANVSPMPDGTVSVSVAPPVGWKPPMMRHVSTCPGRPPFEASGPGFNIGGVLRDGVFHERVDLPLDDATGTKYEETNIRQRRPSAR